jgi:predicted metal-dependent phosphotriesterase family hydrolase
MSTVHTAFGPTLMREHIVTRLPGVQENWPHLPALRKAGVKEDQLEQVLVGNPRAIVEGRHG